MPQSDFLSARSGLFVAVIALLVTGFYAFSLRAEAAIAKRSALEAIVDRDELKAKLEKLGQESVSNAAAVVACQKTVQETELKLNEALKRTGTQRKASKSSRS